MGKAPEARGAVVLIDDYLNEASPLAYMNNKSAAGGPENGMVEGTTDEIREALTAYRKYWLGVSLVSAEVTLLYL